MDDRRGRRQQCRLLADRLVLEYAGVVAPDQVLAAVFFWSLVGDMEAMVEGRRQKLGRVCRRSVGPLLSTTMQ